jgi:class 3 adenylate cyclase/pimeloyl-ACP methyl ester carboxylesterase
MEPQIRYVRSADGVKIAYWALGQGDPPLVMSSPTAFGHLALEWQVEQVREWYERLSANRTIVRFDQRGTGLSQRNVAPDLEPSVRDLDAIVQQLGLEQHDLAVFDPTGVFAIPYAARFPGRVQRLVLAGVFSRPGEALTSPGYAGVLALSRTDWNLFTDSFAHAALGWSQSQDTKWWSRFIRQSVTQADFIRRTDAFAEIDVTELLPRVTARTLIVAQPGRFAIPEQWQEMASEIPDARLVQGVHPVASPLQDPSLLRAIEDFLEVPSEEAHTDSREPAPPASGTAVILFADIADSTALTERLGDAAFREKARALDDALRAIVRDNGGAAIEGKLLGDGVLATFPAASQAIAAALAYEGAADAAGLGLHVGLHAGDVLREANNVYGGAVNIASRISELAAPGEVLVSDIVRGLARTSAGVTFEDRGEHALKGVADPQRVYRVQAAE